MMDHFSSYADQATPTRVRSKPKADKPVSALEQKMQEQQRLSRAFRVWRRNENRRVLASEPRLGGFMRYLKTVGVAQAGELLDAIEVSWLPTAAQDVRIFALRMVAARCDRINRAAGHEALDDPLPPETSVYFAARELLHAGGRS